jgi:hypothetical protein
VWPPPTTESVSATRLMLAFFGTHPPRHG